MSVVPCGCEQAGWSGAGPSAYLAIFLDPAFLRRMLPDARDTDLAVRPAWDEGDELSWQLARRIGTEVEDGAVNGTLYSETLAIALSLHVVRRQGGLQAAILRPGRGGLAPHQLRRVKDHIEDRIADDLSLAELSGLVELSAHHFCRAFKQSTGLPPHRWQVHRRVKRAQELMLTGDLNLAEIAVACGFSDQSHFTTVFRKAVGATPNAWRRSVTR